ncbi:MAG: CHASE2 domain-containing protein [Spirulinaceae cyanobacterium RM2_2_10]|nr:CHASE2 domain-containing protein [Spirulinaceae cyanobacterium SM2_1_0]NJO20177.1 CHASE2 domain-containing protein [Spirulinaceae cyanobacterium RM2_2_10]
MIDRSTAFELEVERLDQLCHFKLSWGEGQKQSARLDYPAALSICYQAWQQAYLECYQNLRGRLVGSGNVQPSVDRRARLRETEAALLNEFRRWLRAEPLYDLREAIADTAHQVAPQWVDVFLTCYSPELERLPWEAWELTSRLSNGRVRLARSPSAILHQPAPRHHRRARILAILGDDTGLNFQDDAQAVRSLRAIADIQFVGWQQGKDPTALKQEICQAIADRRGWDILFFAGHSNETELTGGELGIAPQTSLALSEITGPLQKARQHGLQFALFNSCSGLRIAQTLIELGLNQVAIMREPIHNRVAQLFLVQFLQALADQKDVHEAMLAACDQLQQVEHLNYPSAYLVPSLFRHPRAALFRLRSPGWRRWLPKPLEAAALAALLFLSIQPTVQDGLIGTRLFVQALYRQATQQAFDPSHPPVLLVQIDETSRRAAPEDIKDIYPLNYRYLARLVERLTALEVKILGIDYLLDRDRTQPTEARELAAATQAAVAQNIWLVFGSIDGAEPPEQASLAITNPTESLRGDILFFPGFVELLPPDGDCGRSCPFAYALALAHQLCNSELADRPQPSDRRRQSLQTDFARYLANPDKLPTALAELSQQRLPPTARWFQWLHPIVDFSLPPSEVYETIAAKDLLDGKVPSQIERQAVIVAPGGYTEAGLDGQGSDNFPIPHAVGLWRGWSEPFTGGEVHAYMLHHLLRQRLVVPIPDAWLILLAALLGKSVRLLLLPRVSRPQHWLLILAGASVIYVSASWQIFISLALLLPIVLPLAVFWTYLFWRYGDE